MNILVTGAGSGIGRAVAERFAQNGHTVYAIDVNPSPDARNVISYIADITDENSLLTVREALERADVSLDCIVNVAGIFFMDSFLEIEESRLRRIFDVNLLGAVRVNKLFFPLLRAGGKIMVITSEVAPLDPLPFNGIYGVSKTALDAYTQALRHEAGLLGRKVVTVRPGAVRTPLAESSIPSMRQMSEKSRYFGGQAEKFARIMRKFTGRMLDPRVLANKIYRVSLKRRPRCVYTVHANLPLKLLAILPKRLQVALVKGLIGKGSERKPKQ